MGRLVNAGGVRARLNVEELTIKEFAQRRGVRVSYIRSLIRRGRIVGVFQHPLSKRWLIWSTARIVKERDCV